MECANGCGRNVRPRPDDRLVRVAVVLCRECMTANVAEKRRRLARRGAEPSTLGALRMIFAAERATPARAPGRAVVSFFAPDELERLEERVLSGGDA